MEGLKIIACSPVSNREKKKKKKKSKALFDQLMYSKFMVASLERLFSGYIVYGVEGEGLSIVLKVDIRWHDSSTEYMVFVLDVFFGGIFYLIARCLM